MSWDDHDIFDGWGSYPEELQESAVFQVGGGGGQLGVGFRGKPPGFRV
jgi:hypothetical protein